MNINSSIIVNVLFVCYVNLNETRNLWRFIFECSTCVHVKKKSSIVRVLLMLRYALHHSTNWKVKSHYHITNITFACVLSSM